MLKLCIVETLGEKSLLLPHYLGEALVANARAKYLFALLQAAKAHAEHPNRPPADLRGERQAAQINDATLDGVVAGSQRLEPGLYKVPQGTRIHADLFTAGGDMIRPLRVKDEKHKVSTFEDRLSSQALLLAAPKEDLVHSEYITDIHRKRARFFQNMFKAFDVRWENTLAKHNDALTEGRDFYLCIGRHLARDNQEQERYLFS